MLSLTDVSYNQIVLKLTLRGTDSIRSLCWDLSATWSEALSSTESN